MENVDSGLKAWSALRDGEEDAFADLYRIHYIGLINYCTKLTGSRESANDYVIETLLKLWEKRSRLPMVDNVRSYLLTCVRTTVLQDIRSEKRRSDREHELFLDTNLENSHEDYLSSVQTEQELKMRLAKAMLRLTPRQKELLELRFFHDLDYAEIAERCSITKRTAYNIVFDGLSAIKKDFVGNTEGGKDPYYILAGMFFYFFSS